MFYVLQGYQSGPHLGDPFKETHMGVTATCQPPPPLLPPGLGFNGEAP